MYGMAELCLVTSEHVKGPSVDNMVAGFEACGAQIIRLPVPPFSTEIPDVPDDLPENLFVYGLTSFVQAASEHPVLSRGVRVGFSPVDTILHFATQNRYIQRFPIIGKPDTLRHKARKRPEWFFKSEDDLKTLPGQVLTWEQFEAVADPEQYYVMARPIKSHMREWRAWMVNGQPVMGRAYGGNRGEDLPEEVAGFCRWCDGQLRVADFYCLDVALVNGRYRVVEHTSANWAGVNGDRPATEFARALAREKIAGGA